MRPEKSAERTRLAKPNSATDFFLRPVLAPFDIPASPTVTMPASDITMPMKETMPPGLEDG
jgi:hypothetical protein